MSNDTRIWKRRPDTVEASQLTRDITRIDFIGRWTNGRLVAQYRDGQIEPDSEFYFEIRTEGGTEVLFEGDYILKYWDTEKHGTGFYVVRKNDFELEYEWAEQDEA